MVPFTRRKPKHSLDPQHRDVNRNFKLIRIQPSGTASHGTESAPVEKWRQGQDHDTTPGRNPFLTGTAANHRLLGDSILKAQELERRRLAREIHDGPAQLLTNALLRIEMCRRLLRTDPSKVDGELLAVRELVQKCVEDFRKILFDLRSTVVDDLGLAAAVRDLALQLLDRTGLSVEVDIYGTERRLDRAVELTAFRIVQEALQNVWKHARAETAKVTIRFGDSFVEIVVLDQGRGFDAVHIFDNPPTGHYGLTNIRERVLAMNGAFEVQSSPGHGTKLRVVLPANGSGNSPSSSKRGVSG